jgi:phosphoserine phosphatase
MPSEHGSRRTAIFDVCDTLFRTNTTLGFLSFTARRSGDSRATASFKRWTSRSSPAFYLGALVHRLTGWDLARTQLLRILHGRSRASIEADARSYVQGELAGMMNSLVHDRLGAHRRQGDRILLVSSSLDVVVQEIAREIEAEWLASELEFVDGECTGRLSADLTGGKLGAIASLVDPEEQLHVYTDNRSDRDLLRRADRCTIILPAGRGTKHWAGEDCEYLSI